MIVAHVGPPPRRIGGPAGYLYQLKTAATIDSTPRHDVRFPAEENGTPPAPTTSPPLGLLTRIRRKLFGPKFYRPPVSELARPHGLIDRMIHDVSASILRESEPSLDAALQSADVIFTHDSFSADAALARRRPTQQVWMLCHGVTPMALYIAWSWALPETEWQALAMYADVRTWSEWERSVWNRVDRFILPCVEAGDSFRMIDTALAPVMDRADALLSGAAAPASTGSAMTIRRGAGRVGLYLGSPEPYRGFDALVSAVRALPPDTDLVIAVAGPDPAKVPADPRFIALGRVSDVASLLASVDFLINVNRFSLFDLSTIEAVEAGKPLLLHSVGGNRAFARLGAGCVMIADLQPATIAAGLLEMASIDRQTLESLGARSRACWERELTPVRMWRRHLDFYD
jgi:glycosyltransferase involved in cell wall biosynthesis